MNGEMEECTKVNIKRTRSTALEYTYTLMEVGLKGNGKMVNRTELDI